MDSPSLWEIVGRLAFAVLCGAVLGWEREMRGKPAGFKTHMMVALGSAAVMLLTMILYHESRISHPDEFTSIDPSRVIAGVVGGLGFLGAGTIIRGRGSVHGLTTAATLWVVGSIGVACGLGYYALAGITAVSAAVILVVMRFAERRMLYSDHEQINHYQDL